MAPFATAITDDGRYAFVTFFLSEVVLKVRLADLTVEAKADLSQYFPLTSYRIVLDASERKIFVQSASRNKILVLDAQTLTVIHTIDNIPGPAASGPGGMIRSQHSGAILIWDHLQGTEYLSPTEKPAPRPELEEALHGIRSLATELETTVSRLALAWCVVRSGVTCTLAGARNVEQLENARAFGSLLLPQVAASLDAITCPPKEKFGPSLDYCWETGANDRTG